MGLFDLPTTADGYDVVETVAAQSWVLNNKVGMIGISFPGISQLFVGGAQPPHLGALAPLSTIADIYRAPGLPGGIFNDGFAKSWLQERKDDAAPAPQGGQGWARKRAREGDQTCIANQTLRLQTLDPIEFIETHPYYEPSLMDERSPINWVNDIEVPMFYSASWQDEQTGGDFASMLKRFPDRKDVKITMQNGVHSSTLDPENLFTWLAFLDIYVAHKLPDPGRSRSSRPSSSSRSSAARSRCRCRPTASTASPISRPRRRSSSPIRTCAFTWRTAPRACPACRDRRSRSGSRSGRRKRSSPRPTTSCPTAASRRSSSGRRSARSRTIRIPTSARGSRCPAAAQDESWAIIPPYTWEPLVDGTALAWSTPPLADDVTIAGPSSIDLWLSSSATDTDIQVTLTEVRPDGSETYIQNGWLRASHRRLDRKTSTILEPRPTHLERTGASAHAGSPDARSRRPLPHRAPLPRRLADPHQHRSARRRPHALDVRHAVDRTARSRTRSRSAAITRRGSCCRSCRTRPTRRRRCRRVRAFAASPAARTFRRRTAVE
jgi:predicted acyl esterase